MQTTERLGTRSLLAAALLLCMSATDARSEAEQPPTLPVEQTAKPREADAATTPVDEPARPASDATEQEGLEPSGEPGGSADLVTLPAENTEDPRADVPPVPSDLLESQPPPDQAVCSRKIVNCSPCSQAPIRFLTIDAIFLQRDNGTNNQEIAEDNGGGTGQTSPLFTTRDMRFTVGTGTRIFFRSQEPDQGGWEVGYLGVYGMYGDADANATNLLAVPGPIGQAVPGWDRADTIRPNYTSNLNMVEFNAFSMHSNLRGDRWAAAPWQRICHQRDSQWLVGFRWAELDEIVSLNVIVAPNEPQTSYRVATTSQFFAPQVGWRGRATWDRWMLEGWVKTALAGTLLQSNAAPITSSLAPGVAYRDPRKNSTPSVGFIGDIAITGGYRFNKTWTLRTGYTMIWLTGVALAGNQFDFTDTAGSGTQLLGAGTVFLQGATLGLEARW